MQDWFNPDPIGALQQNLAPNSAVQGYWQETLDNLTSGRAGKYQANKGSCYICSALTSGYRDFLTFSSRRSLGFGLTSACRSYCKVEDAIYYCSTTGVKRCCHTVVIEADVQVPLTRPTARVLATKIFMALSTM